MNMNNKVVVPYALVHSLWTLISYAKWQMREGESYHPTLPSAVASAEDVLKKVEAVPSDAVATILFAADELLEAADKFQVFAINHPGSAGSSFDNTKRKLEEDKEFMKQLSVRFSQSAHRLTELHSQLKGS